tara:strand:- start:261 stop:563 length:303 start_codon:yes stop_codon:yes gene_type:complete
VTEMIKVEVAYALPDKQHIVALEVPAGTSAIDAVKAAKISQIFDDIEVGDALSLGIFSKGIPQKQPLNHGDRVEIYRPLKVDPKEVRKARAAKAKAEREA